MVKLFCHKFLFYSGGPLSLAVQVLTGRRGGVQSRRAVVVVVVVVDSSPEGDTGLMPLAARQWDTCPWRWDTDRTPQRHRH